MKCGIRQYNNEKVQIGRHRFRCNLHEVFARRFRHNRTLDSTLTEVDTILCIPLRLLAVIHPVILFGVVEYFDMSPSAKKKISQHPPSA